MYSITKMPTFAQPATEFFKIAMLFAIIQYFFCINLFLTIAAINSFQHFKKIYIKKKAIAPEVE